METSMTASRTPRLTLGRMLAGDSDRERRERVRVLALLGGAALLPAAAQFAFLSSAFGFTGADGAVTAFVALLTAGALLLAVWLPLTAAASALAVMLWTARALGSLPLEARVEAVPDWTFPWTPVALLLFGAVLFAVGLAHSATTCAAVAGSAALVYAVALNLDGSLASWARHAVLFGPLSVTALGAGLLTARWLGASPSAFPPAAAAAVARAFREPGVAPISLVKDPAARRAATVGAAVVAAALFGLHLSSGFGGFRGPLGIPFEPVAAVSGLAVAGSVVVALWRPFASAALLLAVTAGLAAVANPPQTWPWYPYVLAAYTAVLFLAGIARPRPVAAALWAATAVQGSLIDLLLAGRVHVWEPNLTVALVLSAAALSVGATVRFRHEAGHRLAAQERSTVTERTQRSLLEERARIARELHDVVAHHMSVISVQADSASYRIDGVPEEARREFTEIADSARRSMEEMRRLLGVLRNEDDGALLIPQAGLSELLDLAERARQGGVPVELSVADEMLVRTELPAATELCAFRIVQEALSNVVRHAPGAETRVSVRRDGGALRVTVENAPAERAAEVRDRLPGEGHGLVGMRERAVLLGGTLDAGPAPDGGYRVTAVLPLTGGGFEGA